MKKINSITIAISLLLAGSIQAAEKQSANVQLTLELAATCRLDADSTQGFGSWPTGSSNPSGVELGTISVNCAVGMPYAVGIDAGQHYDGTSRRMSSGTAAVPYVLRANSSNGPEWGDGGLSSITASYTETFTTAMAVNGISDGSVQNFTIWGDAEISNAPEGNYSDTVTITLVW